jgi:hypothetical protein
VLIEKTLALEALVFLVSKKTIFLDGSCTLVKCLLLLRTIEFLPGVKEKQKFLYVPWCIEQPTQKWVKLDLDKGK